MPLEIARVDGKPKQVWQKYPETAEKIVELKEMAAELPHIKHGKTAASHTISKELSFVDAINSTPTIKRSAIPAAWREVNNIIHKDFNIRMKHIRLSIVQLVDELEGIRLAPV
ncbi:MAG: hypothetical protein EF812_05360 [Methanosarcinales archaeon]|nr:MAG: hypothetical protein EF812_05360 [Methanosarcinales archaeon]